MIIRATLVLLLTIGLTPAYAQITGEKINFRVCAEDKEQWPNYIGNSDKIDPVYPGLSYELIKATANELSLNFSLTRLPWKRCLELLEKGDYDGASDASFKEERRLHGRYPEKDGMIDKTRRIATIAYHLYRRKGSQVAWDGKTLTGATLVGAPIGYSVVSDLKAIGMAVDESSATMIDLGKLVNQRVDAVAALQPAADFILEREKTIFADVERIDPAFITKDYFMMISHQFYRARPKIAEALWTKLGELRVREGVRFLQKYHSMPGKS